MTLECTALVSDPVLLSSLNEEPCSQETGESGQINNEAPQRLLSPVCCFHVFLQGISKASSPLFQVRTRNDNVAFVSTNSEFSRFANKIINVSSHVRKRFLNAFSSFCHQQHHSYCLNYGSQPSSPFYSTSDYFSAPLSTTATTFLAKHPITILYTTTFNFADYYSVLYVENIVSIRARCSSTNVNISELALFTNLLSLDCSESRLSDISTLSSCFRLQVLNLSNTGIIDISALSLCTNLREVVLSHNQISDISPLSSCTNLVVLHLSNTSVSDISCLSKCILLEQLSLKSTQVNDLYPLCNCSSLFSLNLSSTPICDLVQLFPCSRLSQLNLTNTLVPSEFRLEYNEREDIKSLFTSFRKGFSLDLSSKSLSNLGDYLHCFTYRLECLNLSANSVSDITYLSCCTGLEVLNLSRTEVDDISSLSTCTKLKTLLLNNTRVANISSLSNCLSLNCLDLSRSLVTDIRPLSKCRYLRHLNLAKSRVVSIETIPVFYFISSLDLTELQVDDISALSSCVNLVTLKLSNTKVSDISPLYNCCNLKTLLCDSVPVSDISFLSSCFDLEKLLLNDSLVLDLSALKNCTNLKHFEYFPRGFIDMKFSSRLVKTVQQFIFNHSGIDSVSLSERNISNLEELRHVLSDKLLLLDMSHYSSSTLFSQLSLLTSCVNLKSLNLFSCSVADISPLSCLIKLEKLILKKTMVADIWPLRHCMYLSHLDVTNSLVISAGKSVFESLDEVRSFVTSFSDGFSCDLSKSKVSSLDSFTHVLQPRLKVLNLANTKISDFSLLSGCVNLIDLDLTGTLITDISVLTDLKLLCRLILASTSVDDVSVLGNLLDLTEIDLSRTKVVDISNLSSCINLTNLSLADTLVIDISPLSNCLLLKSLSLARTQVSDLLPLEACLNLSRLNLTNCLFLNAKRLFCTRTEVEDVLKSFHDGVSLSYSSSSFVSLPDHLPLSRILKLDLANSGISSFSVSCENLKELDLENTSVSDISLLSVCKNLTLLNIKKTQVSDLSPISNCRELQTLRASYTKVTDLSPLSNCIGLQVLYSGRVDVSDISPLSSCVSLTLLNIAYTKVSDLSPLSSCVLLKELYALGTEISDISPLYHCKNMTKLKLNHTKVNDYSPLCNCLELKTLSLSGKCADLSPLENSTKLASLSYFTNDFSSLKADIRDDKRELISLINKFFLETPSLYFKSESDRSPENIKKTRLSLIDSLNVEDFSKLKSFPLLEIVKRTTEIEKNVKTISSATNAVCLTLTSREAIQNFIAVYGLSYDVDLCNSNIENLASKFDAATLKSINLAHTNIFDLTPLASCTELQVLRLRNTKVADLWPLRSCTNLTFLDLRNCVYLDCCKKLLRGVDNVKQVISSFERGFSLSTVEISDESLESIRSYLTARLLSVNLSNHKFYDISLLSQCINLESLNMRGTIVSNFKPLSNCRSLTLLDLTDCPFVAEDLRRIIEGSQVISELVTSADINAIKELNLSSTLENFELKSIWESNIIPCLTPSLFKLNLSSLNSLNYSKYSACVNVKFLNCSSSSSLEDISFISSLNNVEQVNFSATKVHDLFLAFYMC
ncbi:hypothetical protein RCL1_007651 [Eukaryota sp. TZLM3-RCL]